MESLKEQIKALGPETRNERVLRILVELAIEDRKCVPTNLVSGCPMCGNVNMEEHLDGGSLECERCKILYEYQIGPGGIPWFAVKKK